MASHFVNQANTLRLTINANVRTTKKNAKSNCRRTFNAELLRLAIKNYDWNLQGTLEEQHNLLQEKLRRCVDFAATTRQPKPSRLTDETHQLLLKRSRMDRAANPMEFIELSKLIRRKLKEDHQAHRMKRLLDAAEKRRSIKKCRRQLQQQTATLTALKDENGERLTTRIGMEKRCLQFYSELFASKRYVPLILDDRPSEEVPPILPSKVEAAIKTSKNDKAPGPDGITNEVLKAGSYHLFKSSSGLQSMLETRRCSS
uniref:Uncharacterized protein n=1 Tax=Acrobeloides nanus TaxID=290746 RepID=A0A914D5L4_9BILA